MTREEAIAEFERATEETHRAWAEKNRIHRAWRDEVLGKLKTGVNPRDAINAETAAHGDCCAARTAAAEAEEMARLAIVGLVSS